MPFGCMFIEMYYLFSAFWSYNKVYYVRRAASERRKPVGSLDTLSVRHELLLVLRKLQQELTVVVSTAVFFVFRALCFWYS